MIILCFKTKNHEQSNLRVTNMIVWLNCQINIIEKVLANEKAQ